MRSNAPFRPLATIALLSSLLLAAGCGGGGSVPAGGSPTSTAPALALSSTSLTFTGGVGATSAPQTVTLTNTGSATLSFTASPALGGSNPAAFALASTCGSSINAGASCTLTTSFSPTAAQTYSATITMADNASGSPQTINLTGTGTNTTTAATADLSSTSLTFSTAAASTSAAQSVTLKNNGGTTLTGISMALSGANASAFAYTTTCATTLNAGSSCTISVTFAPIATGTFGATLTLTDSAANSPQAITLSGTATAAGVSPTAALSATSVSFGSVPLGTSAATQTVTLVNNGPGTLTFTGITLTGTNASAFTQNNSCATSVGAGSACVFTIGFAPAATGSFSAVITITSNAANSPQTITLSGTGAAAAPLVTLSATSLTFPATTVNTSAAPQSVTITNTGSATLTGLALSITGTNASAFTLNSNCASTLAVNANCTVSINFSPTSVATYAATLSIADNATGAPQSVTLTGSGQAAPAPIVTLSSTAVTFPATTINTTSAASTVNLSNTGNATLNISGITLTGTNPGSFALTTTCGTTLAAGSVCSISVTFKPTAAQAYSASVSIADNAVSSPQAITLSGSGTNSTSTTTRTFYVFPEADNSATPLYALINGATSTIDMTMYALQDLTFTNDLVAACKRGVTVRVILDQNNEKSNDTPDFNLINAQAGCTAVWANKAFQVTHEKSFIIDSKIVSIMSLNLQSQYYSTTRDYALVENDANDIAAIQATFNMDFAAGTTAAGVVGASDYSYQPPAGTDLVWSPTTATANMLAIINNATTTLYIENEEFSATNIVSAVAAAAKRGVAVIFVGESSSYTTNYGTIKAAGASVYYYTSSTGFYVHGKTVAADVGLSSEAVYMGSINYSTASLTQNRELGVYITGNTAVSNPIAQTIRTTVLSDESQPGVIKY